MIANANDANANARFQINTVAPVEEAKRLSISGPNIIGNDDAELPTPQAALGMGNTMMDGEDDSNAAPFTIKSKK